jgi:hypothetical protein
MIYYSKNDGVNHSSKALHDIFIQCIINVRGEVNLGVEFSDRAHNEFVFGLFVFLLDPLVILSSKLGHVLERLLNVVLVLLKVTVLQGMSPVYFV